MAGKLVSAAGGLLVLGLAAIFTERSIETRAEDFVERHGWVGGRCLSDQYKENKSLLVPPLKLYSALTFCERALK